MRCLASRKKPGCLNQWVLLPWSSWGKPFERNLLPQTEWKRMTTEDHPQDGSQKMRGTYNTDSEMSIIGRQTFKNYNYGKWAKIYGSESGARRLVIGCYRSETRQKQIIFENGRAYFSFMCSKSRWASFQFTSSWSTSKAISWGTQVIGCTKPCRRTISTTWIKKIIKKCFKYFTL